jgi:glycosyltransferase involved in cell wall biosynthesis
VVRSPIDVDALRARSANPDALAEAGGIVSQPTVALIGRIAPNKGHKTFLRAATEVDANFLVVGSGDEEIRRNLESLTDDLGVKDRVSFVGFWEDIVDAYALADVVVVPSHNENLPKVIQEALAREVPVVASRDGGIPELIEDGETGLLIDPDDDGQELAAALKRLLGDEQLRADLAAAGLERLRSEFDTSVVSARFEELYRDVLADESTG